MNDTTSQNPKPSATTINRNMLKALRAFVTQAEKVRGFPIAYEPYVGALVAARAAIKEAEGGAQ